MESAEPAIFGAGVLVLVTLHSPKEKFWGAVLELSAAGVSVCGIDLNSFDDFAALVKAGEGAPGTVFFPMHRVERIELDARSGSIPAIAERFAQKAGYDAASIFHAPRALTLADVQRRHAAATLAAAGNDLGRAAQLLGITPDQLRSLLA